MCRGCYVSWRLNRFRLPVRFHYYLCSRVSEKLIELTLFSSVYIDITWVPVGTRFQVIGLMSAEPASSGRHWINRFSQHEIVADLIIQEERTSSASSTSCKKLMKPEEVTKQTKKADQRISSWTLEENSNISICSQKLFRCNRIHWVNYQLSLHHHMLTFEAPLSHAWLANKNSAACQFIAFLPWPPP